MLSFMQFLVNRRPSRILSWRMAFIVAGIAIINWIAPAVAASYFQQVPGVYRQLIGSLQVTALFDGVVMLPRGYLHDLRSSSLESLLDRSYVPEVCKGFTNGGECLLSALGGTLDPCGHRHRQLLWVRIGPGTG